MLTVDWRGSLTRPVKSGSQLDCPLTTPTAVDAGGRRVTVVV